MPLLPHCHTRLFYIQGAQFRIVAFEVTGWGKPPHRPIGDIVSEAKEYPAPLEPPTDQELRRISRSTHADARYAKTDTFRKHLFPVEKIKAVVACLGVPHPDTFCMYCTTPDHV